MPVMGQAGKALKQVLETYNISQSRLAHVMGITRSNVSRWVNQVRDPGAETLLDIRRALRSMNSDAADAFIQLYLEDSASSIASSNSELDIEKKSE